MRWVLMLFVILAAVMGGEARAVVVMGRAVVSERVGKEETLEKRAEALRVESERAFLGAALEARKAAGFVDAGPLMCWFPGGLAVARSDCGDRQAEYTETAAAGSAWAVPSAATVLHVRGPDLGGGTKGLLYSLRNGLPTFNRYNGRGDVVAQSDIDGTTTWAASYQADGRRTAETGTNIERHRACAKEEDPTGLLNEGFRYRDMETGTFISRDPLGHVDGPNVYCYVGQNPWTMWDPEGLWGIGDSNGPVLDYLWDLGGGVVDGGIEAVEGMGHAVAHPIRTAAAVKDGVLAVKDGIGELSSALDAGHVTWGEIGTAYGDGLAEVASDPAKVGKIVGSSAVSLGAGKAAAVGGKLAMAAAVQTNTARTIAVSAVLATTELAPVASGAARGGAIAAQVGTGFAKGAAAADNVATLDAAAIRFSQSNVRSSLPEIAASMKANGWQGAPIDVVRMADGTLTAVDNTRLAAAALSTTPVQATIRGFGEAFPAARAGGSLQGGTWGEALINRIGGQKPGWQRLYPNGSPFTGVHPSTPGFTP